MKQANDGERREPKKVKHPYLYEIDLMRLIFIAGVLLNHTTTAFQHQTSSGLISTGFLATHLMIHFTRMGFMFMTGLVLTMVYYQRQRNWPLFYKNASQQSAYLTSCGTLYCWQVQYCLVLAALPSPTSGQTISVPCCMAINFTSTTFWSPYNCIYCFQPCCGYLNGRLVIISG